MPATTVDVTGDPELVIEKAHAFLASDPVRHNLILTLLRTRVAHPEPGRYWIVSAGGEPCGVAFQSPLDFVATATPMTPAASAAIAEAMASDGVRVPGINGEAATAARIAGHWTETTGSAAWPVQGQRIYEVDRVLPARPTAGELRPAVRDDLDLLVRWFREFAAEVGDGIPANDHLVELRLRSGQLFIWDAGAPVALVGVSATIEGVARLGPVYTEPGERRRGYASAATSAVSSAVRAGGARCILYTDLGNPSSNAIYRSIGYRAVAEMLRYRFGEPD